MLAIVRHISFAPELPIKGHMFEANVHMFVSILLFTMLSQYRYFQFYLHKCMHTLHRFICTLVSN